LVDDVWKDYRIGDVIRFTKESKNQGTIAHVVGHVHGALVVLGNQLIVDVGGDLRPTAYVPTGAEDKIELIIRDEKGSLLSEVSEYENKYNSIRSQLMDEIKKHEVLDDS